MLFSKTVVHGVYMLCYLSRQTPSETTSAATLAKAVDVPREHARKILARLRTAGMIASTEGRAGGYKLLHSVNDISVQDVVEAMNPSIAVESGRSRKCSAAQDEHCPVGPCLAQLSREMEQVLANKKLGALIDSKCHNIGNFATDVPQSASTRSNSILTSPLLLHGLSPSVKNHNTQRQSAESDLVSQG